MKPQTNSLLSTLLKSLILPGLLAALVGGFIIYSLTKEEYDELLDVGLTSKAHLLLKIFEASAGKDGLPQTIDQSALLSFEIETHEEDERTVYWFLNAAGVVVEQSPLARQTDVPPHAQTGLSTVNGYRVAVLKLRPDASHTVIVAEPMHERNEAIRDVLLGVFLSFLLLGLIFFAVSYLAIKRSVRIIAHLSDNISEKNEHNLSPIDRRHSFTEIEPAIDTLDKLMERLENALAAERAFATNAAHELRTPVAISLANVQRLQSMLDDPVTSNNAREIELGLKRLVRLIERLLQMARAQSGLGSSGNNADIRPVIDLMLKELRDREPSNGKLVVLPPDGVWLSDIDPDALGIILSNLFENALKYSTGAEPIVVDARQTGRVIISNDCDPLTPADLEEIKRRYFRKATFAKGFGLGLSIAQELCSQSSCTLETLSPQQGKLRGFTAILCTTARK
jgi:two-component system OmpR family sensor kinase